jgi:predicted nucleic acid-binding protein
VIYLDASALVTYVARRMHVTDLENYLAVSTDARICTSTIGLVETVRTCDRLGDYPRLMAQLLRECTEVPVTDAVRDAAARVPGGLRSLDAIHVASAELLGPELTSVVTYDKRLADAARRAGLPVAMPGLE